MKINLNVDVLDVKGLTIPNPDGTVLTVKEVVINSLLGQTNDKIGGLDKQKCYTTFKKIDDAKEGEVSLTSEEITGIKALVDKFYGPIVIGQVFLLLEGE